MQDKKQAPVPNFKRMVLRKHIDTVCTFNHEGITIPLCDGWQFCDGEDVTPDSLLLQQQCWWELTLYGRGRFYKAHSRTYRRASITKLYSLLSRLFYGRWLSADDYIAALHAIRIAEAAEVKSSARRSLP